MQRIGSRRQVWNRTAKQTSGGLTRSELFQDKYGNIKSRRASKKAKKNKNLKKAGWTFKKGSFGAVRVEEKKKGKKRIKFRRMS